MKKSSLAVLLILLLSSIGGIGFYLSWRKTRESSSSFKVVPLAREKLEIVILSTGIVQPENRLEIKPPIAGRVERILVNEGARVRRGQILAWMSSTERAALMDAARAKGPEEIKQWEDLYQPTPIIAPISGTIIQRNMESGQTFTTQDPILVMSDRLTVKAQVDETDIAQIKVKQKAHIVLDAYPGQSLPAHVDQIAYDAKTVNNVTTYQVDVLPEKTPPFMRSGMTANVSFEITSKENAWVVPVEAIRIENGRSYVMVASQESVKSGSVQPVRVEVETGLSDGKRTEIASGLSENSAVLVPVFHAEDRRSPSTSSPFSPMGRPKGR